MKRLLLAAVLLLVPISQLSAQTPLQPSNAAVKAALTKVISRQLAAFRANDFPKAYTFSASEIQKHFPVQIFEQMVRANYAPLLENVPPTFGITLDDGQQGVVFLELDGAQGPHVFRYVLKLETGGWKISGVEQTHDTPPQKAPLTA